MRSAFELLNRQTLRATPNPLDKCTIISIYPKRIKEVHHTIQPGVFIIEPGSLENPFTLLVEPSSWWKEIDDRQPLLEIPISSINIANSVLTGYCQGLIGVTMKEAMPGVFFVPGAHTVRSIQSNFGEALAEADKKQKNWYLKLVQLADILWARSNGNPLSISDDARLAAQELQLKDKPWLQDFTTITLVQCKACGRLKNPNFPVCPECKAIDDPEKAKELGLVFAR